MSHSTLLIRMRAEFLEMPGLRLTLDQARRLCGVERALCQMVLDALVNEKFLCVKSDGSYMRLTDGDVSRRLPADGPRDGATTRATAKPLRRRTAPAARKIGASVERAVASSTMSTGQRAARMDRLVDQYSTKAASSRGNTRTVKPQARAARIPTTPGDVLILQTDSIPTHAIGVVAQDGQQDFANRTDLKYERDRRPAEALARSLVVPGGRVFLKNIDTGDWSEISTTSD